MKKIASIILFLFAVAAVQAQFVYPNENCGGALPLPVGNIGQLNDSVYQRNSYADGAQSAIPNCAGSTANLRHDLWYSFIAPDSSIAVVPEFLNSSGFFYQLFSGSCGSLSSITCNSSPTVFPTVSGLIPGQQYYLRTFYYGSLTNTNASNYKLSVLSKPVNDECTSAALLELSPPNSQVYRLNRFSTELATASNSSCVNTNGWTGLKDLWYKFTATSTVHTVYIESVTNGSRAICYSGAPGSLVPIAGASFTASVSVVTGAMLLNSLTVGQSYYIRVGATASIKFSLSITGGAPANDECINADTVLMNTGYNCEKRFFVDRLNATNSAGPCNTMVKDVWYVFKATAADISIKATGDGASSLRLGLMEGNCGSLTCLVNGTNSNFNYSGLTVGNYYYLNVAGSTGAESRPSLCISPKITNDECSGAIPLSVKPYGKLKQFIGSNIGATQSLTACGSPFVVKDVWFRFTATDTLHIITVDGDSNGSLFEVFSGNCNSLTSIYCSGTTPTVSTGRVGGLVPGNQYYVRYYSISGGETLFSIDINSLPSNDECSGAVVLVPQQGLQYKPVLNNGINDASQSLAPCTSTTSTKDIWYQFTATDKSTAIISNREGPIPGEVIGFELYSGGCAGLNSITCFSQSSTVAHQPLTISTLVPGQTYYLRQYGNFSTNSISIVKPPANDNITGAIQLTAAPANVQTGPSYYLHGASKQFERICNTVNTAVQHDVWFYFIASGTSHTVSTNATNSFWVEQLNGYNYRIEAFRGFAADSASLAGKLISCATNTLALGSLTPGDTVYLRIASTGSAGNTGIFGIKVSNTQSIDEPAGALLLTKTDGYQYSLSTSGATQSLPASGCKIADFPDDDIWFRFAALADSKRIIAAFETADITMQLFSGQPGSLTPVTCSDNIMVLPSTLINGSTYYLRVYTKANAVSAGFSIGLFGEDDPLNSECAAANCLGPNLVANPRCESEYEYLLPKNDKGVIVLGRKIAEGWWSANYATSDTWNADYPATEYGNIPGNSSSVYNKIPRSGKGMLGMLYYDGPDWNEYITGKLTQPLQAGKNYLVSFYISMSKEEPNQSCFNIGAWLSNDSIARGDSGPLEFTPDISHAAGDIVTETDTWRNICGIFHADKAYNYITIGNFGNSSLYGGAPRTYFFVDDVVVAETSCSVLPLQLLNFNGRMNAAKQTELSWQTANEVNTKNFEVQWSTDAVRFSTIGTVNSNAYNNYRFLHTATANGYNFYRLKMNDNDGRVTYSSIVRTGMQLSGRSLQVYPNPVSSTLNIQLEAGKDAIAFFRIINNEGKTVAIKTAAVKKGRNSFIWDLSLLPAGNYFISSAINGMQPVQVLKK